MKTAEKRYYQNTDLLNNNKTDGASEDIVTPLKMEINIKTNKLGPDGQPIENFVGVKEKFLNQGTTFYIVDDKKKPYDPQDEFDVNKLEILGIQGKSVKPKEPPEKTPKSIKYKFRGKKLKN